MQQNNFSKTNVLGLFPDGETMSALKNCAQCGQGFARPLGYSAQQWTQRKLCSHACFGASRAGVPHTPEAKIRMGVAQKGKKRSPESVAKRSASNTGKNRSPETKARMSESQRGRTFSPETRAKMAAAKKGKNLGAANPSWRGGVTPEHKLIRNSPEYAAVRTAAYTRDNYTCQHCGVRGVEIHADHIKKFSDYPLLRLELTNLRTLCVPCHEKTPTYGARTRIQKEATHAYIC